MTKQRPNLPWNFKNHGFLDPSAFPDFRTWWYTRAVTPIALQRVAHAMSQQIPTASEMSQECRTTPPQKTVSHLFFHPPVAIVFGVFRRENNRRKIGGGGVALELPEVSREIFPPKTDCATRGWRSYTHTKGGTHLSAPLVAIGALPGPVGLGS